MAEQALEPMELESVRNTIARYKTKKGLSDDDAEASAVAAGDLVRRPDGSLVPRGWKPAAARLKPRGIEEQVEDVIKAVPNRNPTPPPPKGSFIRTSPIKRNVGK